jgi:hypothetical protein
MVQIDQPLGGQVAVGQSSVDSQAITEEGIEVGDGSTDVAEESNGARPFARSETIDANGDDLVAPADPSQWQSDRTRRSRQIALVVALSLAGLLSGIAVFSWFVHTWRQRSVPATAEVSASEAVEAADATDTNLQETPPSDLPEVSDEPIESPESQNLDSQNPDQQPENHNPETVSPETQNLDPNPTDQPQSIPSDLIPQSPIDQAVARPADSPPGETGNMQELPPELAKFMPFLVLEGANEAPNLKAPPTVDDVKIDAAAEDNVDSLIAAKPKALNLKADLAIPLALDSKKKGYPLTDLILLVGQITGVPIQLDWVSFDLAGIDIDSRISTPKGWRSAREVLDQAASGLGAEIREEKSLLILTLSDVTFDEAMKKIANLDDFGDARASATTVLKEFLQGDENADARQLQLGGSREEQQLAAFAIESMRRMRGIAPKVADHRLRHWARSSENESVQWPMLSQGDAGPQLDTPITIAELLRQSSRRNQARCVVNWHDANRKGVSPQQLVFPSVGVDAATTLDQTLRPLGLQVRRVDEKHWWIGNEATYDRLPVVVWTSPLGESRDTFSQRIAAIMTGVPRDQFRMTIDEETDRALLLLPRYIVRQLPKIAPVIAAN